MLQPIYNIIFLIGSIFKKIYNIIKGAILYSLNIADLREKEKILDRKQFFRQEGKKQMSRWVTEERLFLNRMSKQKWVPKNLKNNDAYFNYLFSVVMNISPHQTPEEIVHQFYDYIHPTFIQYHHISCTLRKYLNSGMSPERIEHLREMTYGLPDMFKRAEHVMKIKMQIVKKVKELEKNMKKAEDLKNKQIDEVMVKKNIELLEQSINDKNEQLKAYTKALEKEISNDKPEHKPSRGRKSETPSKSGRSLPTKK